MHDKVGPDISILREQTISRAGRLELRRNVARRNSSWWSPIMYRAFSGNLLINQWYPARGIASQIHKDIKFILVLSRLFPILGYIAAVRFENTDVCENRTGYSRIDLYWVQIGSQECRCSIFLRKIINKERNLLEELVSSLSCSWRDFHSVLWWLQEITELIESVWRGEICDD